MQSALTPDRTASGWDRSLYAFLAEKQQRSGSMRTVNAYAGMLRDFFRRAGKSPDAVGRQDAFLGVWRRAVWEAAEPYDDQRPHRLPQQLLPLPDAHGRGRL